MENKRMSTRLPCVRVGDSLETAKRRPILFLRPLSVNFGPARRTRGLTIEIGTRLGPFAYNDARYKDSPLATFGMPRPATDGQ